MTGVNKVIILEYLGNRPKMSKAPCSKGITHSAPKCGVFFK